MDPGPCSRVRCIHPIRIARNRARNCVRGSAYCSDSFRAADYDRHECQALKYCACTQEGTIQLVSTIVYYSLYFKKWYSQKKIILDMIFVQNICV